MIGTIKIRVNAQNPALPLNEAVSYIGSPAAVFVRDVPRRIGTWRITGVAVSVYYPDNSFATVSATESEPGVWVATIQGCNVSGRIRNGFRIMASGIDEDGSPVSGYVLGVGDLAVGKLFPVPSPDPGETAFPLRYFDTAPDAPKKGDVAPIEGVVKMYDGTQWIAFGSEVDLSDYYTKEETDEQIDRLAAYYITYTAAGAAFPTAAALLGAETVYSGGEVRVPTRNDYAVVLADEQHGGAEWRYIYAVADGETTGQWEAQYPIETNDYTALSDKPQINGTTLAGNKTGAQLGLADAEDAVLNSRYSTWSWDDVPTGVVPGQPVYQNGHWEIPVVIEGTSSTITLDDSVPETATILEPSVVVDEDLYVMTATRTLLSGYVLGSQTDKAVASEAEAAALRDGKADKANGTLKGLVKIVNNYVSIEEETFSALRLERGTIWNSFEPQAALPTIKQGIGDANYGTHYFGNNTGTVAHLENIATEMDNTSRTYEEGKLYLKGDGTRTLKLYRCTTSYTGVFDVNNFAEATVADVLNAKYAKPSDGIPATDLAQAVQTSLGKADTAVQPTALDAAVRYTIGSTITASATLADRTMNKVAPASDNTADIELSFPAATADKARDFWVLIDNPVGNTGAITFDPPPGAMIYGDGLTQTFAAGEAWEVTITEVAPRQFLCKALKIEGVQIPWKTLFEVTPNGSYLTAGIYSATAIDSTTPTIVDWGDGNTDSVTGDISQLTHTYSEAGTYVVGISDNISSISLGNYANNRYIVTRVLNISPRVTSIPDSGFNYLSALYYVYAGDSGELSLGNRAFALDYASATSQTLGTFDFSGRTITTIPQQCFQYRKNLDGFLFPQGLTSIGSNAFEECFKLSDVNLTIPEGVTTLGAGSFSYCSKLVQVSLPSTLTTIGTFSGGGVFRNCTSLTEITLPASLTSVGGNSFYGCSNLGTIRSNASAAPSLGTRAFGNGASNYTGSNTASAGTNRLYVPTGATGYGGSSWASTLCDSSKCGFTKVEV